MLIKKKHKYISVLLILFITLFNSGCSSPKTPIDIYLLGGQSNAVGYTSKGVLNDSFDHVGYVGAVDYFLFDHFYRSSNIDSYDDYLWSVTPGLGKDSNYIGPEYGMAKALNDKYETDHQALIFKSGAGGTSLRNRDAGGSGTYGNWYPRSMWEDEYIPDPYSNDNSCGAQYYLFIDNFKNLYRELFNHGYKPVVKGMMWMQGCEDLGHDIEYEPLLKSFIKDIRDDLSDFTKEDMSSIPFIIGEIPSTFAYFNNENVPSFVEMQRRVASSLVNVYTIHTADLIINNEDGTVSGTDKYHFSTQDMVTLGERFINRLFD